MKPKYRIELLDDAVEFLNGLDEKAREKIYYNLKKSQIKNDNTLSTNPQVNIKIRKIV